MVSRDSINNDGPHEEDFVPPTTEEDLDPHQLEAEDGKQRLLGHYF